jgi:alpha-tubulin suppressor-like RCC1 family protein/chitodextrinase
MKSKTLNCLLKFVSLALFLILLGQGSMAAITGNNMTVQAYPGVRKSIQLDVTTSWGSTVTSKLDVAPTKGSIQYFDAASGTFKPLAVGVAVATTTFYYVPNSSFTTTDAFRWTATETTSAGVVSSVTGRSCSITYKAILYPNDWPMFRQDHHHRNETAMELPANLYLQWVREYPAITSAWTRESRSRYDTGYRPVAAGKTIYVGSNQNDALIALNTDTGAERWRFYTDGPIRFAPVAVNGKVYVGSDDGYLYCLDAGTGAVIWKFRGGPADRKVFGNERLISTWPVRGAPVFYNGKIYFACGLWPWEGIFVYALNADTGAVIWKNDGGGNEVPTQPHSGRAVAGISPQGHCLIKSTLDKLIVPCGHAMPAFFDLNTGKLDKWVQNSGDRGGSCFVDSTGETVYSYPVQIAAGSKTYSTGPGVVGTVHNVIAADNKLFVTTTQGKIYCFGGTSVSPTTWPTTTNSLSSVSDIWTTSAAQMITQVGVGEGHAMVWGIGTGRLVEELAKQSKFKIDVYDPDAAKVNSLRQKLSNAGLYGVRVAVHVGSPMSLELPPYTARLIASEDPHAVGFGSDPTFTSKLFNAIRPYGGTAWLSLSSADHSTFASAATALGSSQTVVARNGSFSLLTRSGRLPGSTDFTKTAAAYQTSQDKVVKPPFAAQWYSDKYVFGGNHSAATHPDVIDGYMVDQYGGVYDIYTGLKLTITRPWSGEKIVSATGLQTVGTRTNPFTGKTEDRMYYKGYGCADTRIFGDVLTFRSGNAAYYHLPSESGPVNIGGMRAGCIDYAQIPANGVFVNSSQLDCSCEYPIRTMLGMVNRPDGEQFTGWQEKTPLAIDDEPFRKIGINFGAPGDRMANDKVLWTHKPTKFVNTLTIPTQIEPAATAEPYVHHASWIKGGTSPAWVAASGIKGATSIKVNLAYPTVTALAGTAVVDGKLNDACWNGSSPIELYNPCHQEALNAKLQGLVYLRYDASKLYAAFNYFGTDPAKLYKYNAWDIFITDRLQYNKKYVHVGVDNFGVPFHGIKIFPNGEDSAWNAAGWTYAYTTTTNSMIVEMSIPWSTLAAEGIDKNSLAVNVQGPRVTTGSADYLILREMIYRGDYYNWSPTGRSTCTRFCPVGLGTPVGDLGKTRAYTVRLHFAEPDNVSTGQRVFDIGLQGATVASSFDIVAQAGGIQKSIVKEFTNVQIKDYLNISLTPKTGVPVISGLEVFENGTVTPDTTAPSVPTGLIASGSSSSQINLGWTASTDNVGVVGYKVYRNGTEVGSSSSTSYSDTGLTASTTYNYKVAAIDAAGNISAQSAQVSAATSGASDTTLPAVSLTAPLAGATVSGTVTLSANASDNVGVVGVQFKVDGANVGVEDAISPYSVSWSTTTAANGSHTITAVARDAAGNTKISTSVSVAVSNVSADTTVPTVTMTSPTSGATVSGNITVSASASDNVGVAGVQFKVDGTNLGAEDTSSPYSTVLDTSTLTAGSHSFTAVARDAAGNNKTAAAVTVTISNTTTTVIGGALAGGSKHSVALKDNGTVWTWGYNGYAQLGIGITNNSMVPVQVPGLTGVIEICAGSQHTLALKSDGTVWSWGYNSTGQLGDSTTSKRWSPVQALNLSGIRSIEAGDSHSVALKSDGTVWTWGRNANGQIGNGTNLTQKTAVKVSGLPSIVSIAAGMYYTVAIAQDGTVWNWGHNGAGQLGNGTLVDSWVPIKVNGLANVVRVATGLHYTLALKADGTVWAWGSNNGGQLGNGTTSSSSTPIQISGLANVTEIACGGYHSLAIKSDGTVWTWGYNNQGQLGNGGVAALTPKVVSVGAGPMALGGGTYHSLILLSNGTVKAAGDNGYGELGDNSIIDRNVFVTVNGLDLISTP